MLDQQTELTRDQQEAWRRYTIARLAAGKPPVVWIPTQHLRRGDVLAGGGTLTSEITLHPSGQVAAEIDYQFLRTWSSRNAVDIYQRKAGHNGS